MQAGKIAMSNPHKMHSVSTVVHISKVHHLAIHDSILLLLPWCILILIKNQQWTSILFSTHRSQLFGELSFPLNHEGIIGPGHRLQLPRLV